VRRWNKNRRSRVGLLSRHSARKELCATDYIASIVRVPMPIMREDDMTRACVCVCVCVCCVCCQTVDAFVRWFVGSFAKTIIHY